MPRWIVFSLVTVFMYGLWGFLAVFTDNQPGHYNLNSLVVCSVMAVGLLPTTLPAARSKAFQTGHHSRRGNTIAFLSGILAAVANSGTFFALENGGPAIVVIPLTAAYPILTVIAAVLFLRERINYVQFLGILIGVGGAMLLSATATDDADLGILEAFHGALVQPWFWWTMLNLVGQALLGLMYKLSTNDVSPERSFVLFGLAFSLCALGIFLVDHFALRQFNWDLAPGAWLICLGLGITMGLGILAQMTACRFGKASMVTALTSLYPAVTTLMVVAFLGHELSTLALVGTVFVLAGASAMTYEKRLQPTKIDLTPAAEKTVV